MSKLKTLELLVLLVEKVWKGFVEMLLITPEINRFIPLTSVNTR
jgi:hypothetical protein